MEKLLNSIHCKSMSINLQPKLDTNELIIVINVSYTLENKFLDLSLLLVFTFFKNQTSFVPA